MESLSTFTNISGPIPERPYILGRQGAKQYVGKQVWFVSNTAVGSGELTIPGKFCNFYPHSRWEAVFPALN